MLRRAAHAYELQSDWSRRRPPEAGLGARLWPERDLCFRGDLARL